MLNRQVKRVKTRGKDWVFITHDNLGIEVFVTLWCEYRFYQWSLEYLTELGVKDSNTEWLSQTLPSLKQVLDRSWGEIYKKKPGDPFFENDSQKKMFVYLRNQVDLNASQYYEIWKIDALPLIKKCPECKQSFLAEHRNATYCEKCRLTQNRNNVRTYRKNHPRESLKPIKCGYEKCNVIFIPKTKRAKFHSDICRVLAGRMKKD